MELVLGGVPLHVTCGGAPLSQRIASRYARFRGGASGRPLRIRLRVDPEARPPRYHPSWVDNPPLEASGDLERARCRAPGYRAAFRFRAGKAAAVIPDSLAHADLTIRVALGGCLLARGEGTLLHAAAAVRDGFGLLFAGPSGAGKSTLAGLCREAGLEVLADEMVIVRRSGAGLRVHGTPFWHGSARSAPAGGLFLLQKAERPEVERIPPSRALAGLLGAGGAPLDLPDLQRAFFEAAAALLRRVPAYRLGFRRDTDFLDCLDALPEFAFWRPRRRRERLLPQAPQPVERTP